MDHLAEFDTLQKLALIRFASNFWMKTLLLLGTTPQNFEGLFIFRPDQANQLILACADLQNEEHLSYSLDESKSKNSKQGRAFMTEAARQNKTGNQHVLREQDTCKKPEPKQSKHSAQCEQPYHCLDALPSAVPALPAFVSRAASHVPQ
eukprot:1148953-Pelagomonas_calceolata.AAC.6